MSCSSSRERLKSESSESVSESEVSSLNRMLCDDERRISNKGTGDVKCQTERTSFEKINPKSAYL